MTTGHLYYALKALKEATQNVISEAQVEKVGKIIQSRAIISAASGVGAAIFPGVGGFVAATVAVGVVWEMYVQINKELGISISDNKLKSLASAMLANLLSNVGNIFLSALAVGIASVIPGLNMFLAPIQAVISYIVVFAAGILYVKILTKVFKAQGSFGGDNDMSGLVKAVIDETDMKSMVEELKDSYKNDEKEIKRQQENKK